MIYSEGSSETELLDSLTNLSFESKIPYYMSMIMASSLQYRLLSTNLLNQTNYLSNIQGTISECLERSQLKHIEMNEVERLSKSYDELNYEVTESILEAKNLIDDFRSRVAPILWRLEKVIFTNRTPEQTISDIAFIDSLISKLPDENIMNSPLYRSLSERMSSLKEKQTLLLCSISNLLSNDKINLKAYKKPTRERIEKDTVLRFISHFTNIFGNYEEDNNNLKSVASSSQVNHNEEEQDYRNSKPNTQKNSKSTQDILPNQTATTSDEQDILRRAISRQRGVKSRVFTLHVDGVKYFVLRSLHSEESEDKNIKEGGLQEKSKLNSKIPRYIHQKIRSQHASQSSKGEKDAKHSKALNGINKPDEILSLEEYVDRILSISSVNNKGRNVKREIRELIKTLYTPFLTFKKKSEDLQVRLASADRQISKQNLQISKMEKRLKEFDPKEKLATQAYLVKDKDGTNLILEYQHLTNLFVKISSGYLKLFSLRNKLVLEEGSMKCDLRRVAILQYSLRKTSLNIFSDLIEGSERMWSLNCKPFLNSVLLNIEEQIGEMVFQMREIQEVSQVETFFF